MQFAGSQGSGASRLRRLIFVLAIGLACLLGAAFIYIDGIPSLSIDFEVFWKAARSSELYAPSLMPFAYPPTALLLFKPLVLMPLKAGFVLWTMLSLLVFVFAAARLTENRIANWSLLSGAAVHGLVLGQSAMLLGGAILLAFSAPPLLCGVLFGIVAAIKPQLLLLAPFAFIARRDFRCLAGMAIGCIGMVAAELALFGPALWSEWRQAFPAFHAAVIEGTVLHMVITPAGQAQFHGFAPTPFQAMGGSIGLCAILIQARRVEREMLAALIVAASLMVAPYAHTHDTIVIIPACLVIMMRGAPLLAGLCAVVFVGVPVLTPWAILSGLAWTSIRAFQGQKLAPTPDYSGKQL